MKMAWTSLTFANAAVCRALRGRQMLMGHGNPLEGAGRRLRLPCGSWLLVAAAALMAATAKVGAEDVVYLSTTSGRGQTRLSGNVLDYTGSQLVLQTTSGATMTYAGSQVSRIESVWLPEHTTGDALLARHEFSDALAQYAAAGAKEQRRWVRRLLLARSVRCYRELGHFDRAGDYFLLLVRDDPATPYFPEIPLVWTSSQGSPAVEQKASGWLARADSPVEALMGASHLLAGGQRGAALERLRALSKDRDGRIAWLAQTQAWRAELATATVEQLAAWSDQIERMPRELRAGPYYLLGRGWGFRQRYEDAALALLRVPIEYAEQRSLGAESLWSAGQMLERLNDIPAAVRLYRELIAGYASAPSVAQARQALETLGGAAAR